MVQKGAPMEVNKNCMIEGMIVRLVLHTKQG